MSTGHRPYHVLRRGEATRDDLGAACDDLGIEPGMDFVIAQAPEGDEVFSLIFSRGSETSRNAALDNAPRRDTQRHDVLMVIADNGGESRAGIAKHTHLLDSSVDARVWELLKGGFITESGRTKPTGTGSQASVLILTPKGHEAVYGANGQLF